MQVIHCSPFREPKFFSNNQISDLFKKEKKGGGRIAFLVGDLYRTVINELPSALLIKNPII